MLKNTQFKKNFKFGRTVLIIGRKKALAAALDNIKEAVSHTALEIIGFELYGNDCTYETVDTK